MDEIISPEIWILAGVVLPLLSALLFYDARKRKANAEAKRAEIDTISQYAAEWKDLFEKSEETNRLLNAKIDQLYKEKEADRKRIRELLEKNTSLELSNLSLKVKECRRRGCGDREPPSEF